MSAAKPTVWTGHLTSDGAGGVSGSMTDAYGWTVTITGKRDPNGPGYILTGVLGEVPACLRIPMLDGEAPT